MLFLLNLAVSAILFKPNRCFKSLLFSNATWPVILPSTATIFDYFGGSHRNKHYPLIELMFIRNDCGLCVI